MTGGALQSHETKNKIQQKMPGQSSPIQKINYG